MNEKPKSPIETHPAFINLVNRWHLVGLLDRAVDVQNLLNEGYSGRYLAGQLSAAGVPVDEATIRRDSLIARLPEAYKNLVRSGTSITAVLKKAKADGTLNDLAATSGEESEQQVPGNIACGQQVSEMSPDREAYLRDLHNRTKNIGPVLEDQHRREVDHRDRVLARQFMAPDGTPLNRQERLKRLHDNIEGIQKELDDQRHQLKEYRLRMRARQFGKKN